MLVRSLLTMIVREEQKCLSTHINKEDKNKVLSQAFFESMWGDILMYSSVRMIDKGKIAIKWGSNDLRMDLNKEVNEGYWVYVSAADCEEITWFRTEKDANQAYDKLKRRKMLVNTDTGIVKSDM